MLWLHVTITPSLEEIGSELLITSFLEISGLAQMSILSSSGDAHGHHQNISVLYS